MSDYAAYLATKDDGGGMYGFKPLWLPDFAFDWQRFLIDWAIRKGRASLFEDCGLGKTLQQLVWAENVVRHTNRPVLIITPLAVAAQTVREGDKFGVTVYRTRKGKVYRGINVTNYERLQNYNPADFGGVVCDESSILKNFDGKLRRRITTFLQGVEYRLLATATPAPNDFMELGTSSEALGVMPHAQMLGMFFTNDGEQTQQWTLKPHARRRFWRWMVSWSRAVRNPSDLGFDGSAFVLPKLIMQQHTLKSRHDAAAGGFWPEEAKTLDAQRAERRATIRERCEKVAEIVPDDKPFVSWCHMNAEGDLLTELMPDAEQVSGADDDDDKEAKLIAFSEGRIRGLVTKPKIASFGLNWQHCCDTTFFPSHSYEQFYQAIRRFLRFGQKNDVTCQIVTTQVESGVMKNLERKERQAEEMFAGLVSEMANYQGRKRDPYNPTKTTLPEWL